jgi:hypothetical protein
MFHTHDCDWLAIDWLAIGLHVAHPSIGLRLAWAARGRAIGLHTMFHTTLHVTNHY